MPNPRTILLASAAAAIAGTVGALKVATRVATRAENRRILASYDTAVGALIRFRGEAFDLYITADNPSSNEARRAFELQLDTLDTLQAASSRLHDMYAPN